VPDERRAVSNLIRPHPGRADAHAQVGLPTGNQVGHIIRRIRQERHRYSPAPGHFSHQRPVECIQPQVQAAEPGALIGQPGHAQRLARAHPVDQGRLRVDERRVKLGQGARVLVHALPDRDFQRKGHIGEPGAPQLVELARRIDSLQRAVDQVTQRVVVAAQGHRIRLRLQPLRQKTHLLHRAHDGYQLNAVSQQRVDLAAAQRPDCLVKRQVHLRRDAKPPHTHRAAERPLAGCPLHHPHAPPDDSGQILDVGILAHQEHLPAGEIRVRERQLCFRLAPVNHPRQQDIYLAGQQHINGRLARHLHERRLDAPVPGDGAGQIGFVADHLAALVQAAHGRVVVQCADPQHAFRTDALQGGYGGPGRRLNHCGGGQRSRHR